MWIGARLNIYYLDRLATADVLAGDRGASASRTRCSSRSSRPCALTRRSSRRSRRCAGAVRLRRSQPGQSGWKRRGCSSVAKRLRADDDVLSALGINFKTLTSPLSILLDPIGSVHRAERVARSARQQRAIHVSDFSARSSRPTRPNVRSAHKTNARAFSHDSSSDSFSYSD